MAEASNEVAANIDDYVENMSRDKGSTLNLSDENLSVWTDELRDAVLAQLSVRIDSDYPINVVDLSDNSFDEAELLKAEGDISSDFNAPRKVLLSGNPGYSAVDLPTVPVSAAEEHASSDSQAATLAGSEEKPPAAKIPRRASAQDTTAAPVAATPEEGSSISQPSGAADPAASPEATLSNKVAANIEDYVEKISRDKGSTLDLSDENLSVWTDELRDAVLLQFSVWIDTDYPINVIDLSDNNFSTGELERAVNDIENDFNKPTEIKS